MTPTYIAHPANMDAEEAFSIHFTGPKEGPIFNEDSDAFFLRDARKIARLLVWLSTPKWAAEVARSITEALPELDAEFDSLADFVGEPVERLTEMLKSNVQVA